MSLIYENKRILNFKFQVLHHLNLNSVAKFAVQNVFICECTNNQLSYLGKFPIIA